MVKHRSNLHYTSEPGNQSHIPSYWLIAIVILLLLTTSHAERAQSAPLNKASFIPLLRGASVDYEPMTAVEILAMEPACLQIGMGRAIPDQWGLPGQSNQDFKRIINEPQYSMLWLNKGMNKYAQWFHHYCWGELAKFRYQSSIDDAKRSMYMHRWQSDLEYCLQQSRGTNWVYENHTRNELALAYLTAKQFYKAEMMAQSVLSSDPSDTVASILLIDSLTNQDKKERALSIATSAVQNNPDSEELLTRYRQLGGKMPPPSPKMSTSTYSADGADAPEKSASPAKDRSNGASTSSNVETSSRNNVMEPANPPPQNLDSAATKDKSPYCRFCP